jgi:hypothetical protein
MATLLEQRLQAEQADERKTMLVRRLTAIDSAGAALAKRKGEYAAQLAIVSKARHAAEEIPEGLNTIPSGNTREIAIKPLDEAIRYLRQRLADISEEQRKEKAAREQLTRALDLEFPGWAKS